ncbi:hypothetical protein GPECTOR_18g36 [Gonium pectorale]|uniref:Uncharacterized protein n=1 Tax=Gonium pectorale TaxID=33097 RepID=A0A150GJS1_GONPE|nr:hypothetical protein GPECTOR_18g36 [Gonium pectorale]|eukprot:KXZ50056.1 hypothetical protein GPECTOR_18g36 [Gonium pectorale]
MSLEDLADFPGGPSSSGNGPATQWPGPPDDAAAFPPPAPASAAVIAATAYTPDDAPTVSSLPSPIRHDAATQTRLCSDLAPLACPLPATRSPPLPSARLVAAAAPLPSASAKAPTSAPAASAFGAHVDTARDARLPLVPSPVSQLPVVATNKLLATSASASSSQTAADETAGYVRAEMALSVFTGLDRPAAAELGAACAALGLSLSDARRLLARPHGERLLFAALRRAPGLGDPAAARIVRRCYESMWRERTWEVLKGAGLALVVGAGVWWLLGGARGEYLSTLKQLDDIVARTARKPRVPGCGVSNRDW